MARPPEYIFIYYKSIILKRPPPLIAYIMHVDVIRKWVYIIKYYLH